MAAGDGGAHLALLDRAAWGRLAAAGPEGAGVAQALLGAACRRLLAVAPSQRAVDDVQALATLFGGLEVRMCCQQHWVGGRAGSGVRVSLTPLRATQPNTHHVHACAHMQKGKHVQPHVQTRKQARAHNQSATLMFAPTCKTYHPKTICAGPIQPPRGRSLEASQGLHSSRSPRRRPSHQAG